MIGDLAQRLRMAVVIKTDRRLAVPEAEGEGGVRRSHNGVAVYAVGVVSVSACAPQDMGREDVAAAVNVSNPTGIGSPWTISENEKFASGEPMPCPCEHDPETRVHWLLHC